MNCRVVTHVTLVLILVCVCAPLHSAPGAPSSHWELVGPGGGGSLFEPTISPRDPNRIVVACDMTGSYLSDDGGASWRMFNLHGRVKFFVFDPHDENVIYAQSIGLFRSANGGRSWKLVYPDPATVTSVSMANDHAGEKLLRKTGPAENVTALAVDPGDSKILYAGFEHGGVYDARVSTDSGKSWQSLTSLPAAARRIYVDPRSSQQDRTIDVLTAGSVLVRGHGNWKTRTLPLAKDSLLDVAAGFPGTQMGTVIYAASSSAVFVSDDGGATWRESHLSGSGARIRAIAASPSNPDVAYLSFKNLEMGLPGFRKTWFGVARTSDRGRSWTLAWQSSGEAPANLQDAWITQFFGSGYGENPLALEIAPSNPDVVYVTDYGRVLRTTDGGSHWEQLYSTRLPDGTFTSRGLESTTSYGVHFDPFDGKRVFITYTDIGLFRSENGGQSWTSSISGVPPAWWNTTYWMVFDPTVRGRAWAVVSAVHDLPRPKMWERRSPASYDGGVVVSNDGGKSWQKSNAGMAPSAATHILLNPASPPDARVLYVAAFGHGVYKSTDSGRNWSLKNNGIAGNEPLAWRLARDSVGTFYLIVARRSDDGSIANDGDGALYRSSDGAEHWTRVTLPGGVNGPNGLAIDPSNPKRLYLAAWGRSTRRSAAAAQGGGIFVSSDAGNSWRNVLSKDQHVYDVSIDPRDPKVIYAAGFESSAWRSTDAGASWRRITGFNFKWGHRVIPDPADAHKIYVTTFGGGVWHGPATGTAETHDELGLPDLLNSK